MAEYGRIGQASDYGSATLDNRLSTPFQGRGINRQRVQSPATGAVENIDTVNVDVELKYDPKYTSAPWAYELSFPLAMNQFFADLGHTSNPAKLYHGQSLKYLTAEEATTAAETEARLLAEKYVEYVTAKAKTKRYTLSIQVDKTNPEKDNDNE